MNIGELARAADTKAETILYYERIGLLPAPPRTAGNYRDYSAAHARLMLTVLWGLAELERELIRARTTEGRRRAVACGVKVGRRPKLTPHQMKQAIKRRDAGEPVREIARSYNVSHSTISRLR